MTQIQVSQSLEVRRLNVANLCGEMARQSKAAKCSRRAVDSRGESARHTVIYLYDKFCSVDMNVHATCIQCVDHLCGDLLSRITVLR